jgi:HK97 family phage prohead protease
MQMKVSIRADSVLIEGYVNAIERDSKPLMSRIGQFIERICKGAFSKALKRNDDVHVLLNHDWTRDLGSTKQGNLELKEDNIGLHARAVITDSDVVQKARQGDLVGWSFGFQDREVEQGMERGLPLRSVKDLDLFEVSILDRTKTPAYDGTLLMARSEEDTQFYGEAFLDELEIREEQTEKTEEIREENQPQLEEHPEADKPIDYSKFEAMILEMKGETK